MPGSTSNIPRDLSDLLKAIAADFPLMLSGNLAGIYLWGSLTYEAFDETCSDVDCVVVTRRDLDDGEFSSLDSWFREKGDVNRWVARLDMRFVIDGEFLDKSSRCCGFYHHQGVLVRHASDGNPIIWLNVGQSGIVLYGAEASVISPAVSADCLNEALLLELTYLKEDLVSNVGNRSAKAFAHNAYAVLTACRILFSAHRRALVSKDQACHWAMERVPRELRAIILAAHENRAKNRGRTTVQLEQDAMCLVDFVSDEVNRVLARMRSASRGNSTG